MIAIEFLRPQVSAIGVEWRFDGICDAFKLQLAKEIGTWTTQYFGHQKQCVVKRLAQSTCFSFQVKALVLSDGEYTVIATSDIRKMSTLADLPTVAALQRAIKKGQNHLLGAIFEQKPNLIDIIFANKLSVLGQAVMANNEQAVPVLLQHGADVNVGCTATRRTPLHLAMAAGHLPLAKCLLAHQADLNATDKTGHNVVHFAVSSNSLDAVKFCWAHKADFEVKDCMGWTPLLWALITNTDRLIIDLLLSFGSDQRVKDANSLTALQHAHLIGVDGIENRAANETP